MNRTTSRGKVPHAYYRCTGSDAYRFGGQHVRIVKRALPCGDYGVANALGFISYLMTGIVGWIYLRRSLEERTR